ncbi:hypothetical protein AGABI2DRAFT_187784 [Agaricus bisporus var. bisporus H97]|uniref:hypothetical protein n=1 Tax=Agaricus bisporus var. bisporus (strain H97 / ATCC MYA-4626 / FGSC 10389) TaxID=936046 RepID=UPI00029F7569|nr:hypothetical protein AGABI2DRAFT_187784 [Agaricus bisporus var. bisporus H97]EKV44201.1 hypothetical protein AGABI2DRAFT_187784 [Agaricus bisporus var. bisporus H97]
MPARVYPSPEHAAFRDLNIFEERLRETAAGLQRRKHRYQLFLAQLLAVIILLLIEVLLPPDISILSIPYKAFLCWLLPEVYANDSVVILHPYFTTGLLFVSVTTLVLFFASGTYSEKIAYANKYVPHTNRALRAFNMFFNTRQPPLRSKFLSNPLSFFFPRPNEITKPISSRSPSPSSPQIESPSTSSTSSSTSTSRPRSQSSSRPIHSIPPARNSRGEIIFSRRVSKEYQEGYDRYRANFEKKREEVLRLIKAQKSLERWRWWYKLRSRIPFSSFPPPPPLPPTPTITPTTTPNLPAHPTLGRTASNASSNRGRSGGGGGSSRSGTPPTPGSSKSTTPTDRSGSPMRQSRSSTKRSPNRRTPSNNNNTSSNSNSRRDGGEGEGDMRMQALSRSLAQERLNVNHLLTID